MKTFYTRNMKTVKDGDTVTIIDYVNNRVIADYDAKADQLIMKDLVTIIEGEDLLALARRAAMSPAQYEDSREIEILKRSRTIAKATLIGVAVIVLTQIIYIGTLKGCW